MVWEDCMFFDVIEDQFGVKEFEVICIMKKEMKLSSWKMWWKWVQGWVIKYCRLWVNQSICFKFIWQKYIFYNNIFK